MERYVNYGEALERLKSKGYKYTGKRILSGCLPIRTGTCPKRCKLPCEGLSRAQPRHGLSEFIPVQLGILEGTEWEGNAATGFGAKRAASPPFDLHRVRTDPDDHICPMNAILVSEDFEITGHKFVYGRCAECGNQ